MVFKAWTKILNRKDTTQYVGCPELLPRVTVIIADLWYLDLINFHGGKTTNPHDFIKVQQTKKLNV